MFYQQFDGANIKFSVLGVFPNPGLLSDTDF